MKNRERVRRMMRASAIAGVVLATTTVFVGTQSAAAYTPANCGSQSIALNYGDTDVFNIVAPSNCKMRGAVMCQSEGWVVVVDQAVHLGPKAGNGQVSDAACILLSAIGTKAYYWGHQEGINW